MQALRVRPTILLPLRERSSFLDYYYNQGDAGGVFVPGNLRLASAEEVDLEILFAKEQVTIHTRGIIRWKRLAGKRDLPAGIGVEFLAAERATRDLLLELARGRDVNIAKRRSRRYPAMLEIDYATNSVFLTDVTDDLSKEGAAIHCDDLPDVGAIVPLRLKVPDETSPIDLKGEVRWRKAEGRKCFGVRFVFESPQAQERLAALVDRIKQQVATELSFSTAEAVAKNPGTRSGRS
ncbi:MAG: PilZ domain-containing protein [Deltaproteobacteria bacterium]|nr:PilZ domain-containing protein [Deltaproteobacteria bacterium]